MMSKLGEGTIAELDQKKFRDIQKQENKEMMA